MYTWQRNFNEGEIILSKNKREEIRQLDHRAQAREKLPIFFGSADNYIHGLKEVMGNSTDEIMNNFEDGVIDVELHDDNKTITIKDSGRGIPMAGETDGTPNYELLFLILFAGTKYGDGGKMDGSYVGVNGVGNTVLNYTSELFRVVSIYDGKKHTIEFRDGGELYEGLTSEDASSDEHGTEITFRLDPEVYTETEYTSEQVKDTIMRYAVSSDKITINYKYKDETEAFHYSHLEEYFNELLGKTATSPIRHGDSVKFDDGGEETSMEIAFATATEAIQESYLNISYLPNGGAINNGIINGVKLYMNKYCRDNNLFPRGTKTFLDSDIEESISFVAVAFSNNVEFSNQTKLNTQKKLYREVAKKRSQQMLEVMEIEDKKGFEAIVKHLLLVQKDNKSNQRQKEKLKKKLTEKVDNMSNNIDNFVDCSIHGEDAELYLAEGDSAHGSVVLARDGEFQASLAMGGKFLNVVKASSLDKIVNNEIVMNVIKVLGSGIDLGKKHKDIPAFDISKLRYGKIICASDEDPDGAQITTLIITLFHELMPQIIEEGKLYIAQTPLYEIKLKNDDVLYTYTDEGRDELIKEHGKNIDIISRSKGLGELSVDVMAETAMDPETRHLVRVNIEDAKKASQAIEDWMGNSVENRKDFISENLNRYVDVLSE